MFDRYPSLVWNPSAMLPLVLLIVLGSNAVVAVNITGSLAPSLLGNRDETPADPQNLEHDQYRVSYKNTSLFSTPVLLSLNSESMAEKDKPRIPQSRVTDKTNNQLYMVRETNFVSMDKNEGSGGKGRFNSLNNDPETTPMVLMKLKDKNNDIQSDTDGESLRQKTLFLDGNKEFVHIVKTQKVFDEKETLSGEQKMSDIRTDKDDTGKDINNETGNVSNYPITLESTTAKSLSDNTKPNSFYVNKNDKNVETRIKIQQRKNRIQLKSVTLNAINPTTNYKTDSEETNVSSKMSQKINDHSETSIHDIDAKTHFQLDSTYSLNLHSQLKDIISDKDTQKIGSRKQSNFKNVSNIGNRSVSNSQMLIMDETEKITGTQEPVLVTDLNSSNVTIEPETLKFNFSSIASDDTESIKMHTLSKSDDIIKITDSDVLKTLAESSNVAESLKDTIHVSSVAEDMDEFFQNDSPYVSTESSFLVENFTHSDNNIRNNVSTLPSITENVTKIKMTEIDFKRNVTVVSNNESNLSSSTIDFLPLISTVESTSEPFLTPSDVYADEIYFSLNSTVSSTVSNRIISIPITDNSSVVHTEDYTEFMSSDVPISPISSSGVDDEGNSTGVGGANSGASSDSGSSTSSSLTDANQWPVKHAAVVEGDLVLGGLMMVHEREDSITCGPVMPQGGVQALEAMLYTLDKVNNDPHFLPNITLGAHILDDCDKDTYGLEMAVDFIKGSISNIDGAEYHCNKTQVRKVISGVVGAASSVTSIQVANLLRLFKIPQVSFFSTSPELSNKQRFEFFSRTIPSDHYQVKAMVDIVKILGWSYVSIIYEESNYGIKAFEELEELLAKHDICIAVKEKLVKDSGVAEEIAYDNIVQKLLTKTRARGCIIFGSDQEVAGVMRAVRRSNATGSFSWIGSDGWSARSLVSNGNEAEVEGTLSVQPKANPVKGFEEYFLSLTVENNRRNPWFVEFWEDHFHCQYPNSSWTPYRHKYTKVCTTKEKLTKQNTVFEDQLQFVSDAVMAFAHAIKDMHKALCRGGPGLCDAMKPTKGTDLLKYLRTVEFEGLSGDKFKFDSNGDGPARYNIIHFKQVKLGKYRWIRVGEYIEGELRLNMSEIQFKLGHPKPPESVCSLPCDQGQAKKYVEGESCCWHCFNCTQYQIRHPLDETQCVSCPQGTIPDIYHVRCNEIPEVYLRPNSGWAIGAMTASTSGILVTLFVFGVFIKFNDTPVVRASGRELSYVLLVGILMCYCVTYVLVMKPTDIVCGLQRFGAGFCFTVVYAALFTKTNRIARIFNAGKHSAKRPSFISPRSQLIICSGLVFIQVLINGVWMLLSPARAIHHYPTREDNLLVCSSYIDASYMIAFTYPIFLIVVCTVYAILTRKIPEAFNESKFIGFTMYTTCVIWLAFVPLYFGTANHVALRITSMSVTISLSASVTVICLFSPKLYIILIRPERNVRQSMMPARYSVVNNRTATTNSGAGSMMAAVMVTAATCNQKEKIEKHVPPNSEQDLELVESKKEKIDKSTQTVSALHARIVDPPVKINNTTVLNPDSVSKINNTSTAAVLVANSVIPSTGPPVKINNNTSNNNSKTETIGNGPLVMQTNQTAKDITL